MLTFNPTNHQYTWNGVIVPSVTQIIGEWQKISVYGVEYYCNRFTGLVVNAETFRDAGHYGTAIHTGARMLAEGRELDLSVLHPSLNHPLVEFQQWMIDYRPLFDMVESPMYSPKYRYAGTPDIVATIKRKLCVIDIKTGAYSMAGVQTSGYEQLYRERVKRGTLKMDRYVLHLPKAGKYKFIPMNDATDFDLFRSLFFAHNEINRRLS